MLRTFLKTKPAKITFAAVSVAAVLALAFFCVPGGTDAGAQNSFVRSEGSESADAAQPGEQPSAGSAVGGAGKTNEQNKNTDGTQNEAPPSSRASGENHTASATNTPSLVGDLPDGDLPVGDSSGGRSSKKLKNKKNKRGKKSMPKKSPKTPAGQKDKFNTDPTPAGKPGPVEPGDVTADPAKQLTCTFSIRCDAILDNLDQFNKDKLSVLPSDGVIFAAKTVAFSEGESVFDVLLRLTQAEKIHMEHRMTPVFNSVFIEGIHNIYEFDCGPLSGWTYKVNDWSPNYGCSRYVLKQGDVVEWVYSCDLSNAF